jgi:hypothetical protein
MSLEVINLKTDAIASRLEATAILNIVLTNLNRKRLPACLNYKTIEDRTS